MLPLIHPGKRRYLSQSLYVVRCNQSPTLPPCDDLFTSIIIKSLNSCPWKCASKQAAETIVYRIALDLVDSPRYRYPLGTLTPTGEQLLHICRGCLNYYLTVGYVTREEYDEHSYYLTQCEHEFEQYSVI